MFVSDGTALAANSKNKALPPKINYRNGPFANSAASLNPTGKSTSNEEERQTIDRLWRPTKRWVTTCIEDMTATNLKEIIPFNVKWPMYRLGDCIKLCKCFRDSRWNKSFLSSYDDLSCRGKRKKMRVTQNLTLVRNIMDLSKYTVKPPRDEVVIHLRLGDVIERSPAGQNVSQFLFSGGTPFHHGNFRNSIKSIHEYLDNLAVSKFRKVHIRGGSHIATMYVKSRVYAGCLKRAIATAGYSVTMELDSADPDGDFFYMSHAKSFIVAAGGYSRIIKDLVNRTGGQVIGRTF